MTSAAADDNDHELDSGQIETPAQVPSLVPATTTTMAESNTQETSSSSDESEISDSEEQAQESTLDFFVSLSGTSNSEKVPHLKLPSPPIIRPEDLTKNILSSKAKTPRMPNEFFIYRMAIVKELKAQGHKIKMTEVSKIASNSWKGAPRKVKAQYRKIARETERQYIQARTARDKAEEIREKDGQMENLLASAPIIPSSSLGSHYQSAGSSQQYFVNHPHPSQTLPFPLTSYNPNIYGEYPSAQPLYYSMSTTSNPSIPQNLSFNTQFENAPVQQTPHPLYQMQDYEPNQTMIHPPKSHFSRMVRPNFASYSQGQYHHPVFTLPSPTYGDFLDFDFCSFKPGPAEFSANVNTSSHGAITMPSPSDSVHSEGLDGKSV